MREMKGLHVTRSLPLIALVATLTACAPASEVASDEVSTTGELATKSGSQAIKQAWNFGAQGEPFAFNYECTGPTPCDLRVITELAPQTLVNLYNLLQSSSGTPFLLQVNLSKGTDPSTAVAASIGWENKPLPALSDANFVLRSHDLAKFTGLSPGVYSVTISRATGLPSPDFAAMPVTICAGSPASTGDCRYSPIISPTTISGSISRYTVLDPLLGTGSNVPAVAEAVELVRSDGTRIANALSTTTDTNGTWMLSGVLADDYALRVAGSLYPLTVEQQTAPQQVSDIQL